MGHSHIILIDEQGLNELHDLYKDDPVGAAQHLGEKVLSLCGKFSNPLNRFCEAPSSHPQKRKAEFTVESIGCNIGAIAWIGFPGSDRDEAFYWGATLKPVQELDSKQLAWMKKRIDREIEARGTKSTG